MNRADAQLFYQKAESLNLEGNKSTKWIRWTEQLWSEAEQGWLKRDGQDHFYRDTVVIPALFRTFDLITKYPLSIVDLGCGDGHSALQLLAEFKRRQLRLSITLVDRSQQLLSSVCRDLNLASSLVVQADFTSCSWSRKISQLQHPTVFLAIFLLQELPDLDYFFDGVRELMLSDEYLLAVVPAPKYAESLRRSSRIKRVVTGSSTDKWRWAGEYPISTVSELLSLPHFQRTLEEYRRAACIRGLKLINHEDLCIPDTRIAHNVFAETVYGCSIIGRTSAKLLVFTSS